MLWFVVECNAICKEKTPKVQWILCNFNCSIMFSWKQQMWLYCIKERTSRATKIERTYREPFWVSAYWCGIHINFINQNSTDLGSHFEFPHINVVYILISTIKTQLICWRTKNAITCLPSGFRANMIHTKWVPPASGSHTYHSQNQPSFNPCSRTFYMQLEYDFVCHNFCRQDSKTFKRYIKHVDNYRSRYPANKIQQISLFQPAIWNP